MDEADRDPGDAAAHLRRLATAGDVQARLEALAGLVRISRERAQPLVRSLLGDPDFQMRRLAFESLLDPGDPQRLPQLLRLARDEDWKLRHDVLAALARHDDPKALGELLDALDDHDEDVREEAGRLLAGDEVLAARYVESPLSGVAGWQWLRRKVEEVRRWGEREGERILDRRVRIGQYRQGLGRTRDKQRGRIVEIEVSNFPLTSGHRHGEEVVKGLILHEIGHHFCDLDQRGAATMAGIARSEGVSWIFDVLRDERLERIMQSIWPETGVLFDRLAAYAFADAEHLAPLDEYARLVERTEEEVRRAVEAGELPGRVVHSGHAGEPPVIRLRDRDMIGLPGALEPCVAFLMCLRCSHDPRAHPEARVAQAVSLVDASLKDMPHHQVLELARRIVALIGSDDECRAQLRRMRRRIGLLPLLLAGLDATFGRAEAIGLPLARGASPTLPLRPVCDRESARSGPVRRRGPGGGRTLRLGEGLHFPPLLEEEVIQPDPAAHAAVVRRVRKHVRVLRAYLERLGTTAVPEYGARRGARLDLAAARRSIFTRTPNLLVHSRDEIFPDLHLGILIDRSGSMEGDKIRRARAFAVLLAESARGLRGIDGHVNAFDDEVFCRLGTLRRCAAAALECAGGNNDAGALACAAGLAIASGKRNKLLVMISDGSPTECTVAALRNLVELLTRTCGIVCAQVAVDAVSEVAFEHFVDLSAHGDEEAVARFGRLIVELTERWRHC